MKTKLIYILAALALTFVSADATTKQPKSTIRFEYMEQANGDYRLFIFASGRALVCEEKDIKVVEQGDAVNPVVLSCDHSK